MSSPPAEEKSAGLSEIFSEMARSYTDHADKIGAYADQIEKTAQEEDTNLEALFIKMTEEQTVFADLSNRYGTDLERQRRKISRRLGRDLSLGEAAKVEGLSKEFETVRNTIERVSTVRVALTREIEKIRDTLEKKIGKIGDAKKVLFSYNPTAGKGRRVDGQI